MKKELTSVQELNLSEYKTMLNSDLTILIGLALLKNHKLQILHFANLNLYDIDVQTLISASKSSLKHLRKLSFKRTTFMDKIKRLELLLSDKHVPKLAELNLNMTNVLIQLEKPADFFKAIEKSQTLQSLNIASLS